MGSRSAETMKILEARTAVLARLRGTLDELQERTPSLPSMSGALPKIATGGGSAGMALWVMRKAIAYSRAKRKKQAKRDKREKRSAAPQTAVSVKVFPTGTAVAIVAAAAIWAGVKVYEMQRRGPRAAGSVSPMRKGA